MSATLASPRKKPVAVKQKVGSSLLSPLAPAPSIPTLAASSITPAMGMGSSIAHAQLPAGTVSPQQLTPSLASNGQQLSGGAYPVVMSPKSAAKNGLLHAAAAQHIAGNGTLSTMPIAVQQSIAPPQSPKRASQATKPKTTTPKQRKQKPPTKRATKRASPAVAAQPILPRPTKSRGKITADEVQLVQTLIERCLTLYMNQAEVITALQLQANIEPSFTSLVWLKLEEQNPDFFRAYHMRLRIKEQINAFNYLVSQQAQLLQKTGSLNAGLSTAAHAPGMPLSLPTSLSSFSSGGFSTVSTLSPTAASTLPASAHTASTASATAQYQLLTAMQQSQPPTTTSPATSLSNSGSLPTTPPSGLHTLVPRIPVQASTSSNSILSPIQARSSTATTTTTSTPTHPVAVPSTQSAPAVLSNNANILGNSNTSNSIRSPSTHSSDSSHSSQAIPQVSSPSLTTVGETPTVPSSPTLTSYTSSEALRFSAFGLPTDMISDESSPRDETPILEDIDTNQFFMTEC